MEEQQRYFLAALGNDQFVVLERAKRHPTELIAVTEIITGAVAAKEVCDDLTTHGDIGNKLSRLTWYLLRRLR